MNREQINIITKRFMELEMELDNIAKRSVLMEDYQEKNIEFASALLNAEKNEVKSKS